jgi:hypothetical protein
MTHSPFLLGLAKRLSAVSDRMVLSDSGVLVKGGRRGIKKGKPPELPDSSGFLGTRPAKEEPHFLQNRPGACSQII